MAFACNWPIFILTTSESFASQDCIEKLEAKGLNNFLAHEVPADLAQKKYDQHFDVVMKDIKQTDDRRVQAYNGHWVFYNFAFKDLGEPDRHE